LAGRSYESEKRVPDPELAARVRALDRGVFQQHTPVLEGVIRSVVEERLNSPWLVDHDVMEVYKALRATFKTLSSGIYYESLPEGPVRLSLYRRLKTYFDQLMQPQSGSERVVKVSEMLEIMDLVTLAAELHSGTRPRSRRYLDWLMSMSKTAPEPSSSGLIHL
jgi:hypothetical protein